MCDDIARQRKEGAPLDFILATDDLAFSRNAAEYKMAAGFFDVLSAAAEVPRGRIFSIPGGIQDRKPAPKEFAPRFEKAIEVQCAEKPRAVEFYKAKIRTLLADETLAAGRIDTIDEAAIEKCVQARGQVQSRWKKALPAGSINRELATLRRLLRLAHEWKEIQRVPRVRLLRGERNRESVLSPAQEAAYLAVCPFPLSHVAALLLDMGLRLGEALSLEWPQARLEPAQGAKFGYPTVLSGKAKSRKSRKVPLSELVVAMLKKLGPKDGGYVFRRKAGSPWNDSHFDQQHACVRELLKLPPCYIRYATRSGRAWGSQGRTPSRSCG